MKAKAVAYGEKRKKESNAKGDSRPASGAVGAPAIMNDDKPSWWDQFNLVASPDTGKKDEEPPDHATEESNFMFASTEQLHDFDNNLDFPTSTVEEVEEVPSSKIAAPADSGNLNLKLSDAEAKYWSATVPQPTASELGSSHTMMYKRADFRVRPGPRIGHRMHQSAHRRARG